MTYAGIGAREAPEEILEKCVSIGEKLAEKGYVLRSGGAQGCDFAFELGHRLLESSKMQIFLPWKGFNNNQSQLYLPNIIPHVLVDITKKIYPAWDHVSDAVRRMHARNVQQILGENADDPSDFVVCYTDRPYGEKKAIGGTMFGIVLATERKIPVFNLFLDGDEDKLNTYLDTMK